MSAEISNEQRPDSIESIPSTDKQYKWDIVWVNVIVIGLLHVGALYGFYLKLTSPHHGYLSSIFCKVIALAGSFGITAGAHRLWTHRSYKANTAAQILLIFMATCTYQNSIYVWARDHRMHHKYAETDADPHNAKRGFFFSHVGWLLVRKHAAVKAKGATLDMSDLESNPIVMFQHRHYYKLVLLIAVVAPLVVEHYLLGVPWREAIFIYTFYRYVISVNTTWCVNSFAHLYGFKPYDRNIGPTENPLAKIICMGEGFHNFHHVFPYDYQSSEFVDWRNPTRIFIDGLAALGWVWDRRVAPKGVVDKRVQRTGDNGVREFHMQWESSTKWFVNLSSFVLTCSYVILL